MDVKLKSCYEHTCNNASGCKMSKSNNGVHGNWFSDSQCNCDDGTYSSFESSDMRTTISEW